MNKKIVVLLLVLLFGCFVPVEKKSLLENKIYSIKSGPWSNPETWDLNRVPRANDIVVISKETVVGYDIESNESIANITISGKLMFNSNKNTSIRVGNIIVFGRLEIGSNLEPIEKANKAVIKFVLENESSYKGGFNYEPQDIGLWVISGSLEVNGHRVVNTWTRLGKNAERGDEEINLDSNVNWSRGDHIFITATSFNMNETEENYIEDITDNELRLRYPLKYGHYGSYPLAAEVGLLTRNVVITSDNPNERAHTIVLGNAWANISYAEFSYLGPRNILSRYPIHFHMLGDRNNSYILGNSVWNSGNRCITVHDTNKVLVKDNVAFNASGHCFFLETGNEEGNEFSNNLGALVFKSSTSDSDARPSVFWITNPRNTFINNSAAASEGPNYWFMLNASVRNGDDEKIPVNELSLTRFDNNTGHSSLESALFIEGFGADVGLDGEETSTFNNLIAWKSNVQGVWARGRNLVFRNVLLFDNPVGFTFADEDNLLEDSVIIGDYESNGSYVPKVIGEENYLQGFNVYDGPTVARNVTFINFTFSKERPAGAVSYKYPNEFVASPDNKVVEPKFVNSNEFYFPAPNEAAENSTVANVIYNNESFCLVPDSSFNLGKQCEFNKRWNSWRCGECTRVEFSGQLVENYGKPVLADITLYRLGKNSSQVVAYGKGDNLNGSYRIYIPPGDYNIRYGLLDYTEISILIKNVSILSTTSNLLQRIRIENGRISAIINPEIKQHVETFVIGG